VTPKILFQSDTVLVIDKPAGLAVHRGPRGGGGSLEDDLPALQMGKRHLPQPAHRLDQDTAGCLVLGRTKPAMAELGGFFARGEARKTYWAVLSGALRGESGKIDAALLKTSSAKAGWRMVVDAKGQAASTLWRVLGRGPQMTWVEFQPLTGRTHQLRAHAAHLGHPILGDARYGGGEGAMQLLARRIVLPGGIDVTAPVPGHMLPAVRTCGG
jgi:RluA family pseudouridine synthase